MTERDFVVKPLPATRLAERSATAASQPEVGPLVGPLFDQVADALFAVGQQLGPGVAYYETLEEGGSPAACRPGPAARSTSRVPPTTRKPG